MGKKEMLRRIRCALHEIFGDRLRDVVFCGPERWARDLQSEIEVLALLDGQPDEPGDSWACIDALDPLCHELGRTIRVEPADIAEHRPGDASGWRTPSQRKLAL